MKNKVIRLAVVAMLVVAMTLTMTACVQPQPSPSPSTSPSASSSPSTSPSQSTTPSTSPSESTEPVADDEAKLEEKYGLKFADVAGVYTAAGVKTAAGSAVTFGISGGNDLYKAILADKTAGNATFDVTAKVTAVNHEGAKLSVDDGYTVSAESGVVTPIKAGVYTVTYTVKIAEDGSKTYGYYTVPKMSESYTVTKTYTVAKANATISVADDAFKVSTKPTYTDVKVYEGATLVKGSSASTFSDNAVLKELGITVTGTEGKYTLGVNIITTDLTVAGEYELAFVCQDAKGNAVDLSTLVSSNYNVTFENGTRYILTAEEVAAVNAVNEAIKNAAETTASNAAIQLALSSYEALSKGAKIAYEDKNINTGNDDPTKYPLVQLAAYDLQRADKLAEAKRLADVWYGNLKNTEDGVAFVSYVLSLSKTAPSATVTKSDYDFVKEKLTGSYYDDAWKLVDARDAALKNAFSIALSAASATLSTSLKASDVAAAETALANLEATFAAASEFEDVKAKADKVTAYKTFVNELRARYDCYMNLVDGLDNYIGGTKDTYAVMVATLDFDFDKKEIKLSGNAVSATSSAAEVVFAFNTGAFTTPVAYIDSIVATYANVRDCYIALDEAIVSAKADIEAAVVAKIQLYVVDTTNAPNFTTTAFDGDTLVKTVTRLEALKSYLATETIKNFAGYMADGQLAKKGLEETIKLSLKEPVNNVNSFIKNFNG